METSFLKEIQLISICFNPLKETAFILYKEKNITKKPHPNNLYLVEEDFSGKIIKKRFKLLQKNELIITNQNIKRNCYDSLEGYFLHFWEASEKLIVVYPFSYILIYDYNSTELIYHFQCTGIKNFVIRNLISSPIENCIFVTGENFNFIYCLDYSIISSHKPVNELLNNKINIPKDIKIMDIVVHPNEKFFFVAYADGLIRIYDYNNIKKIKELDTPLMDWEDNNIDNNNKNKINKSTNSNNNNTPNIIKEPDAVNCLDINTLGNFLIDGTERGNIHLWDSSACIKNNKILYKKENIGESIFSCKFIKTRQFGNLQKFILLTKNGNLLIYFILIKDSSKNNAEKKNEKSFIMEAVYKKQIFDNPIIPNAISKYNLFLPNLINISFKNNILSVSYPKFTELDLEQKSNDNDCTLVFNYLITKIFYLYRVEYPKINYPCSIQLKNRFYQTYIPIQGQPNFENKVYFADSFFIYLYDISTNRHRKLINYAKEFGEKKIYLIKFDIKDMVTKVIFFLLIGTDFHRNYLIILDFDFEQDKVGQMKTFENINDFVILGNSHLNMETDFVFFLGRDMIKGFIFQISNFNINAIDIGNNIIRAYHSPFNLGYCLIYRNLKNEYKFSQNFTPETGINNTNTNNNMDLNSLLNLKCGELFCFKLEENEIIIDILFNSNSDYYFCAVSLLDKINIYNREMKLISNLKFDMMINPYITSSLYFLDCTLIYSRGSKIYYFYPYDNINQLIFTNIRSPCIISGVLPDRFILISLIENTTISLSEITSPMITPLEPILIGYLDTPDLNKDLIKQCVVTMFSNQVSQNLIEKLIKKNLKELAWMFINDDQNSLPNLDIKMDLLNENLKFEKFLDNFDFGKDLNNKLDLDELIWRFNYDHSLEYVKNILIKQTKILISYGQYESAIKILELLGDYPLCLNLLMISTSQEDFDKLRIKFEAKESLNFTDNIIINHQFHFDEKNDKNNNTSDSNNLDLDNFLKSKNNNLNQLDINDIFGSDNILKIPEINDNKMEHYHKIFDNYEGEHYIFGANQNEFKINSISDSEIQKHILKEDKNKKLIDLNDIKRPKINFGHPQFKLYSDDFNIISKQFQIIEMSTLILQKIENYYGIMGLLSKNEKEEMNRRMTFFNYNLSLNRMRRRKSTEEFNNNIDPRQTLPYLKSEDIEDDDEDIEISDELHLSAYYHMDKGMGNIIEDITDNKNDAIIDCIYTKMINNNKANTQNLKKGKSEEIQKDEDLKEIWGNILEENSPLEYEDKWGRGIPPSHGIVFTKKLKTKISIKYSKSFQHLIDKFTIELWIKLKDIDNVTILNIETLKFEINKGIFKLSFHDQEIPSENIKNYTLPLDTYIHLTFLYKKTFQNIIILINTEEVVKFHFILSNIENNSNIIFGNENFEGEMTEIRIWNQRLPYDYIKENYKTPLAILAENKRKLKMNIDTNIIKNTKVRENRVFEFGDKNKKKEKINEKIEINNNNNQELNDNNFANEFERVDYPSMDVVNNNEKNNNFNDNMGHNEIYNIGDAFNNQNNNGFVFQENDFNFDQ